jgi:1-acyl-sn-glycerol-3-phosphate acyltransferase
LRGIRPGKSIPSAQRLRVYLMPLYQYASEETMEQPVNAQHGAPVPGVTSHTEHPNQFALLGQRRFAPFFWTQFSGAANDNLFKFAFTVMVTYQLQVSWMQPAMAGLVIGALFILPYLLFSATSGQITDKYEKSTIIRFVKNLEIAIMAVAAYGFLYENVPVLLACTFLMGLHSTLFGPVKFAYLPQVLSERELTGGNGMVEMGTFVAILLGNIVGGLLIATPEVGRLHVAVGCIAAAIVGRAVAQFIPLAPATDPGLKINWNPVSETWRNLKMAHGNLVVFRSLLGISWMWFFGAVFLSQFPSLAREVLHGNEQVASFLLVVFSIGIATGSLLCEVLSRRHVEIGLVPLGAIGMTVFAVDFYFATRSLPPAETLALGEFLARPTHWRVLADLMLLSLFAGLYSVPMYALIQLRAQPTHRARIIAANNILNALFMIASSVIAGILLQSGFSIPQIFLFTGLANAVVAFYIFMLVPEYLLRFFAWVMSHVVYRFKVRGDENIPLTGPAVLVCNHVSFVDAVLLMAASPRPIYFVMDHHIFRIPLLGAVFRLAKAIPVAPRRENETTYEQAFERAAQVLRKGELLAIFPEGGLTRDGSLQEFKGGVMKILERAQQDGIAPPVVPMGLTNLWGSYFSRIEVVNGARVAMVRPFRRGMFSRVGLNVGQPVPAAQAQPALLRDRVAALLVE